MIVIGCLGDSASVLRYLTWLTQSLERKNSNEAALHALATSLDSCVVKPGGDQCQNLRYSVAAKRSANRSPFGRSTTTTSAAHSRRCSKAASGGALRAPRLSNLSRPSPPITAPDTELLSPTARPRSKSRWPL